MRRLWVLSGIIVVLTSAGAGAAVGLTQSFEIGAINALRGPGQGSAEGSHQVMIGQEQRTVSSPLGTGGLQKETGVFVQTASISGPRTAGIRQSAGIDGAQEQTASTGSQRGSTQGQNMGVDFTARISMPGRAGAATGTQSFVGGQTHTVLTPISMSTESQVLGATQYTAAVGGPNGSPLVTNTLEVNLGQGQLLNFAPPPVSNP